MASEVLYVNCQELHNPQFTPQVVSEQSEASSTSQSQPLEDASALHVLPECQSQQPAAVTVQFQPTTSLIASTVLDRAVPDPLSPSQETHGCQTLTLPTASPIVSIVLSGSKNVSNLLSQSASEGQKIDGQNVSQLASELPTDILQDSTVQSENATEEHNMGSSRDGDAMPNSNGGRDIRLLEAVSNPKPTGSQIAADDEVQFILSVVRKRRKKRPKPDPLPGFTGLDSGFNVGKSITAGLSNDLGNVTPMGLNRDQIMEVSCPASPSKKSDKMCPVPTSATGRHPRLHPQDAAKVRYPNASDQESHRPLPSMPNAHGALNFARTVQAFALTPGPSLAISSTETQETTKRKRDGDENNITATISQLPVYTNANTPVSVKMPVLRRYSESLGGKASPQYQPPNTQQFYGTNSPRAGQHTPGFGYHGPAYATSPQSVAPVVNMTSSYPVSQNGHGTDTNKPSVMSSSMIADLRRRPSLYSVPQWQPLPLTNTPVLPITSANPPSSSIQNQFAPMNSFHSFPSSVPGLQNSQLLDTKLNTSIPQPSSPQRPPIPHPRPAAANISHPRPYPPPQPLPPRHPPNILVDIAQTCQSTFPFAAIAKRHNQPVQKVFEIFSEVIQLPLLESAADARKSGKIRSARMKDSRSSVKGVRAVHKEAEKGRQAKNKARVGNK